MGTIIVKNAVVREKGYLYYIDGSGNLCRSVMARGNKKKVKAKPNKPKKEEKKGRYLEMINSIKL
jgi:hypothetical protein